MLPQWLGCLKNYSCILSEMISQRLEHMVIPVHDETVAYQCSQHVCSEGSETWGHSRTSVKKDKLMQCALYFKAWRSDRL